MVPLARAQLQDAARAVCFAVHAGYKGAMWGGSHPSTGNEKGLNRWNRQQARSRNPHLSQIAQLQ